MKKLSKILISLVLALCFVVGFACEKPEKKTITIACPDGAPALAIYNLLKDVKTLAGYDVEYKVVGGAQNIATVFTSGEADIAVMPTNVSAKLYNKGIDLKQLSVNVFGVLYMVGKTPVANLSDLLGKVVLNIGRGGSPDITLKFILDSANLEFVESDTPVEDKVAIKYVNEASEVIAALKAGTADYGVMGEPAVSNAVKITGASIVLDMQSIWENAIGEGTFTQAGIVLNKRVYGDKRLIDALNKKLTENLTAIYEEADKIQPTLEANGSSLKVAFNKDILDRCNLDHKSAKEIRTKIEAYYNAVMAYDPTFIGGKLPSDGFYL